MDKKSVMQDLAKVLKTSTILVEEPMKKHTSFKIGGIADIYIKVEEVEDIKEVLKYAKQHNIKLTIIGNGSNVLVLDKGIRGITLEICLDKQEFEEKEDGIIVTVRCRC